MTNTKIIFGLSTIIVISFLVVMTFTEPHVDSYPTRHYNTSIVEDNNNNNNNTILDTLHLNRIEVENNSTDKNNLLFLINKKRLENTSLNLSELQNDQFISELAQLRASDMLRYNRLSHNTTSYGLVNASMDRFGIKWFYCAENAGISINNASMVSGWINSSGHYHNLMSSKYTRSGIGIAKKENTSIFWYVQLFAD